METNCCRSNPISQCSGLPASDLSGEIDRNGYDLKATFDNYGSRPDADIRQLRFQQQQGVQLRRYTWDYVLFDGSVQGSVQSDGEVSFHGTGTIGWAGFGLTPTVQVDLNPAGTSTIIVGASLDVSWRT